MVNKIRRKLSQLVGRAGGRPSNIPAQSSTVEDLNARITLLEQLNKDLNHKNSELEDENSRLRDELHKLIVSTKEVNVYDLDGNPTGERLLVTTVNNLSEILEQRLSNLSYSNQFKIFVDKRYENEIWLCLSGDTGAGVTKLSVIVGNVATVNSYENCTVIGQYCGVDTIENLFSAFGELAAQANSMHYVSINGHTYKLHWFNVGDIPYTLAVGGRKGASSKFPFVQCKCQRKKGTTFHNQDVQQCIVRTKEELMTQNIKEGQLKAPLFTNIEPIDYIAGQLHLFLGIGTTLIDDIEKHLNQLDALNVSAIQLAQMKETRNKVGKEIQYKFKEQESIEEKLERTKCELETLQSIIQMLTSRIYGTPREETIERIKYSGCCAHQQLGTDEPICFEDIGYSIPDEWLKCECINEHKWMHRWCMGITEHDYQEQGPEMIHSKINTLRRKICSNDLRTIHERTMKCLWMENYLHDTERNDTETSNGMTLGPSSETHEITPLQQVPTNSQGIHTARNRVRETMSIASQAFIETVEGVGYCLSGGCIKQAESSALVTEEAYEPDYLKQRIEELEEIEKENKRNAAANEAEWHEMMSRNNEQPTSIESPSLVPGIHQFISLLDTSKDYSHTRTTDQEVPWLDKGYHFREKSTRDIVGPSISHTEDVLSDIVGPSTSHTDAIWSWPSAGKISP
uniref:Uncharacterized protein n=1 Tax=Acrobeloides nanus TaxID=290746 RepID=A0A914CUW3_9BILA